MADRAGAGVIEDETPVIGCDHVHIDGACVYLLRGPTHEYHREPIGDRWCFRCRKRLPHDFVVMGDPPEVMSYYDPSPGYRCSGCGQDHTRFPGMERTWGDE